MLIRVVKEAVLAGACRTSAEPVPRIVRANLGAVRAYVGPGMDDDQIVRALMAWTYLFGSISFELFGHRVGAVADNSAFFRYEMNRKATYVGLP